MVTGSDEVPEEISYAWSVANFILSAVDLVWFPHLQNVWWSDNGKPYHLFLCLPWAVPGNKWVRHNSALKKLAKWDACKDDQILLIEINNWQVMEAAHRRKWASLSGGPCRGDSGTFFAEQYCGIQGRGNRLSIFNGGESRWTFTKSRRKSCSFKHVMWLDFSIRRFCVPLILWEICVLLMILWERRFGLRLQEYPQ